MNNNTSSSHQSETEDIEVSDFLNDVEIALGHDYQERGRRMFPHFSPEYDSIPTSEFPLYKRLATAYSLIEEPRRSAVLVVLRGALVRCARVPLGLRRSLACLDLAHEIAPVLISGAICSDLLLRPEHRAELAEWLWQLIQRWQKWNIKVVSTPLNWERAIGAVAPKGIHKLIDYYYNQNAVEQPDCWKKIRQIALERIEKEDAALLKVGQDPDSILKSISALNVPSVPGVLGRPNLSGIFEEPDLVKSLSRTLRPAVSRIFSMPNGKALLEDEMEWCSHYGVGPAILERQERRART